MQLTASRILESAFALLLSSAVCAACTNDGPKQPTGPFFHRIPRAWTASGYTIEGVDPITGCYDPDSGPVPKYTVTVSGGDGAFRELASDAGHSLCGTF